MDSTKREKARLQSIRWRATNAAKHRASVKAWREANPDKAAAKDRRHSARRKEKRRVAREERLLETADERASEQVARKERRRAYARARHLARSEQDRERSRANSRAWRLANPGKSGGLVKAWKEKNRERVRAAKRARKTAKRVTLVRDLTKLQRGRCAYCRIKLGDEFHVDHVTPLKRNGPDQRSNLQLTCAPCNQTKHAQDPIDFARSTGRLL